MTVTQIAPDGRRYPLGQVPSLTIFDVAPSSLRVYGDPRVGDVPVFNHAGHVVWATPSGGGGGGGASAPTSPFSWTFNVLGGSATVSDNLTTRGGSQNIVLDDLSAAVSQVGTISVSGAAATLELEITNQDATQDVVVDVYMIVRSLTTPGNYAVFRNIGAGVSANVTVPVSLSVIASPNTQIESSNGSLLLNDLGDYEVSIDLYFQAHSSTGNGF